MHGGAGGRGHRRDLQKKPLTAKQERARFIRRLRAERRAEFQEWKAGKVEFDPVRAGVQAELGRAGILGRFREVHWPELVTAYLAGWAPWHEMQLRHGLIAPPERFTPPGIRPSRKDFPPVNDDTANPFGDLDAVIAAEGLPALRQIIGDESAPAAARVAATRTLAELAGRLKPERVAPLEDKAPSQMSAAVMEAVAAGVHQQIADLRQLLAGHDAEAADAVTAAKPVAKARPAIQPIVAPRIDAGRSRRQAI
ncbi:MAG: hypothetical protein WCK65_05320 [Rhodospirillaceae bacterium]